MTDVDVWGEDRPLGRGALLLDVGLALGIGLLGLAVGATQSRWSVLAAVLLSVALAVRRVSWPAAFGLSVAGGVAQIVGGDVNVVADLAYAPIAFSFGAHRSAKVRWFGLVSAVAGVVVAGTWAALHQSTDAAGTPEVAVGGTITAALAALVLLGGWLTGFVRWQRREAVRAGIAVRLQSAEERRLQDLVAQEQERTRIAADMHDVVAHSWAVVAAQADGARYLLRSDPDRAEEALGVIGETARTAMTDVRQLLTRLREPGVADAEGDLAFERPEALVGRMRASGMTLDVRRSGTPPDDPALASTARRVLAESLTNALKHGDLTTPVRVEEEWQGQAYRLRVENARAAGQGEGESMGGDGTGARAMDGDGHGLRGMAERVGSAGGTMSAGPTDRGRRWVLCIEIPSATTEDAS